MTNHRPTSIEGHDLDLWLIDKDSPGATKPGPGGVYDRAGLGLVVVDERGRDLTFVDTGTALELWAGPGARITPSLARDLARALERFADYAEGWTALLPTATTFARIAPEPTRS